MMIIKICLSGDWVPSYWETSQKSMKPSSLGFCGVKEHLSKALTLNHSSICALIWHFMAIHSDGSNSDDTWIFGNGENIYNHPHKCHLRKARDKEGVGQQAQRQTAGQRIKGRRRSTRKNYEAIQIVSKLMCCMSDTFSKLCLKDVLIWIKSDTLEL